MERYCWDYYPVSYNSWLSAHHAKRLQRFGRDNLLLRLRRQERPMIIALHMFAEDLDELRPWLDMIYEVAAPDRFGLQIDFLVDDMWAACVFEQKEYFGNCNSSGFTTQSPPLIFGVNAAGEVHFFGSTKEANMPCLESLYKFCDHVLNPSSVQHIRFEKNLHVPDLELAQFNDHIYGEQKADIVIGFYSSQKLMIAETNEFLEDLVQLASRLQNEQVKVFKMNVHTNCPPKNLSIQTTPAMFLLRRAEKHKAINFRYPNSGIKNIFQFVVQHTSVETSFYDRRGSPKLHAELLKKIQNYFNEDCQLINKAYNETYTLKKQLFNFQQKKTHQLQEGHRKRKRKFNETTQNAEVDSINEYLKLLPDGKNDCGEALARHWEDEYKMPQLHGSNTSGNFQKFQSNENTFIIPHATRFYNHNVDQLTALLPQLLPTYDLIVIDPPWRNKYIRRLKRVKQELGYAMMDTEQLALLPLGQLTHKHTLLAIWCTNSSQHQHTLETQLLPRWSLRLLHKLRWYKLNTAHQLIGNLNPANDTQKQPYELLYIACHVDSDVAYAADVQQTELLLSVPSIVHSHKPPLLAWLGQHLKLANDQTEPNCLELFARYLQPQFTSIGLEVLRLMDERLYDNKIKDY